MTMKWNNADTSTVGEQLNKHYYEKKALIDVMQDLYFLPLSDPKFMPKHYGEVIKAYHFLPILDDRNVNDQGIDATGAVIENGNMYGSSSDYGVIVDALPILGEEGGEVNRVGYHRETIESKLDSYGFYSSFTEESLNFDTMDDLYSHYSRETINAATNVSDDLVQMDLSDNAGVIQYTGEATSLATISGETVLPSVVTYDDIMQLSIQLDKNRSPKTTRLLKGANLTDTRTVAPGRIMYIGTDLQLQLTRMVDSFGNPAFVPVEQYAYAADYKKGTDFIAGEIGKIGPFRIVVVPRMMKRGSHGAEVTDEATPYLNEHGNYSCFPMLTVGEDSFVTVGFNSTAGSGKKFKIITKMPGNDEQASITEPYARLGFMSIQWYYGFLPLRPERIGIIWTLAEA